MNDSIAELYQDIILEHAKRPHHFGNLEKYSHFAMGHNPLCGDKLFMELLIQDNIIADLKFNGHGCALSIASASILSDLVIGKRTDDCQKLFEDFHAMMLDEHFDHDRIVDNSILKVFISARQFPIRVKCVTLAWHAFHAAMSNNHSVVSTEE